MDLHLLPPEILRDIITRLPDLDTLDNLIKASSRSWRLFNNEALAIVETILSNTGLLPPQIKELFRAVILTRSFALPFESLDNFMQAFVTHIMPDIRFRKPAIITTLGPESLARVGPPAAVLRSVVSIARHITELTYACLHFYLSNLRDPTIITQHGPEKGILYRRGYGTKTTSRLPPWDRKFIGTPVEMRDAGPPTWIEEMRVRRALWLIQLVGDLKSIKNENAPCWSHEDIERIRNMDPEDLTKSTELPPRHGGIEEIQTVRRYLQELEEERVEDGKYYRLPQLPAGTLNTGWNTQQPEACVMTWGDVGFMYDYGKGKILIEPTPEIRQLYPCPRASEAGIWGQTRESLNLETPGTEFFMELTSSLLDSPLPGVGFDSFRHLGIGIWDQKRLHFAGLLNGVQEPYHRREFYYFAWESLLSAEEINSIKDAARQRQHR